MKEKLELFKKHVLEQLDELERELERTKGDWEQRKGVFRDEGYVYKENLNIFEAELLSVKKTRQVIEQIDLSLCEEISDFKARVISELEDMYDSSVLLRSGIAIIIGLINRIADGTGEPPTILAKG